MADLKEFQRKMEKTLDVLASDFAAVRAGRANAQVLDRITVEYYGQPSAHQPGRHRRFPRSPHARHPAVGRLASQGHRKGHPDLGSRHQPAE